MKKKILWNYDRLCKQVSRTVKTVILKGSHSLEEPHGALRFHYNRSSSGTNCLIYTALKLSFLGVGEDWHGQARDALSLMLSSTSIHVWIEHFCRNVEWENGIRVPWGFEIYGEKTVGRQHWISGLGYNHAFWSNAFFPHWGAVLR